jgi:hypothetical protein
MTTSVDAMLTFERSQIANFKVLIQLADRAEFPRKNASTFRAVTLASAHNGAGRVSNMRWRR